VYTVCGAGVGWIERAERPPTTLVDTRTNSLPTGRPQRGGTRRPRCAHTLLAAHPIAHAVPPHTGNEQDALDATQEALIAIMRGVARSTADRT
jgi:hypothetical protein